MPPTSPPFQKKIYMKKKKNKNKNQKKKKKKKLSKLRTHLVKKHI